MLVPGHDDPALRGEGGGQKHVILWILADRPGKLRRVDDYRVHGEERQDGFKRCAEVGILQPELVTNTPVLFEDGGRQDQDDLPRGPRRQDAAGTPPKNTPEISAFVSSTILTARDAPWTLP